MIQDIQTVVKVTVACFLSIFVKRSGLVITKYRSTEIQARMTMETSAETIAIIPVIWQRHPEVQTKAWELYSPR